MQIICHFSKLVCACARDVKYHLYFHFLKYDGTLVLTYQVLLILEPSVCVRRVNLKLKSKRLIMWLPRKIDMMLMILCIFLTRSLTSSPVNMALLCNICKTVTLTYFFFKIIKRPVIVTFILNKHPRGYYTPSSSVIRRYF